MSRGDRITMGLLLAYIAIGIVTFGHAAAHHPVCVETGKTICVGGEQTFAGLAAAVLWPLYWSWEAWS